MVAGFVKTAQVTSAAPVQRVIAFFGNPEDKHAKVRKGIPPTANFTLCNGAPLRNLTTQVTTFKIKNQTPLSVSFVSMFVRVRSENVQALGERAVINQISYKPINYVDNIRLHSSDIHPPSPLSPRENNSPKKSGINISAGLVI